MAPYWGPHSVDGVPVRFPVHKACKQQAMKDEAYECQVIDADCNDCRHFDRDTSYRAPKETPGSARRFRADASSTARRPPPAR